VVGCWDRARLDQVISNLLSNAMKYGAGQPVQVTVVGQEHQAVLSVRDDGIGVAPEHQARIFARFERAVSNANFGGLGLGLWIVSQVVESMGGRVTVESGIGQGATFMVCLPYGR
jgi:signal transduction histidine kinase